LANYFGLNLELRKILLSKCNSFELPKHFFLALLKKHSKQGGLMPMPCLPAISIVGDVSAPDVQHLADYLPEHGPEDAAVREADAWSPIASDATVYKVEGLGHGLPRVQS
jgi:hypothetical protein